MAKEPPTSIIRPGDRPEKNGEGTAYELVKDLIMRMSDEIKDPDYVDGPVNESSWEVVWTDREYRTHRKQFTTEEKAKGYAQRIEKKDNADKYGNVRSVRYGAVQEDMDIISHMEEALAENNSHSVEDGMDHYFRTSKLKAGIPGGNGAELTCPECGSTNVTPAFGHKLNKCDSCHFAFDEDGDDDGDDFPMEAVLKGKSEIRFEDGMSVHLDDNSRRTLAAHWKKLSESKRPAFAQYVRRSHGNFCRTLASLTEAAR